MFRFSQFSNRLNIIPLYLLFHPRSHYLSLYNLLFCPRILRHITHCLLLPTPPHSVMYHFTFNPTIHCSPRSICLRNQLLRCSAQRRNHSSIHFPLKPTTNACRFVTCLHSLPIITSLCTPPYIQSPSNRSPPSIPPHTRKTAYRLQLHSISYPQISFYDHITIYLAITEWQDTQPHTYCRQPVNGRSPR